MLTKTQAGIKRIRDDICKEEVEHYIQLYFSGELVQKINNKKTKMEEELSEYYYNTLNSAFVGERKQSDNLHSDPTGWRAINLADYQYQLEYTHEFLLDVKEVLDKLELSIIEWELLKIHFDCSNKKALELYSKTDISRYKIRKKRKELADTVYRKIKPLLDDYIKKLE